MTIKMLAGAALVVIVGVTITPYCGLLFGCGCSWPLKGFYFACDYFSPHSSLRCPWCVSTWQAAISIGGALLVGLIVVFAVLPLRANRRLSEFGWRTGGGLLLFYIVAMLAGWLAAVAQGYPFALSSVLMLIRAD